MGVDNPSTLDILTKQRADVKVPLQQENKAKEQDKFVLPSDSYSGFSANKATKVEKPQIVNQDSTKRRKNDFKLNQSIE